MKNLPLLICLWLFAVVQLNAQTSSLDRLLLSLDTILIHSEDYAKEKEMKIKQLRMRKVPSNLEEKFWFNKMFYDEYYAIIR